MIAVFGGNEMNVYIETKNGIPALMIDGKEFDGGVATISSNIDGVLRLQEDYYERLGKAGIRLFFIICDTSFTRENGFDLFREEAKAILRAVPNAYIIPRVGLQPTRSWTDAHPEAMVGWSDGCSRPTTIRSESYNAEVGAAYSLHSPIWRKEAGEALLSFAEQADRETFGDRIIGYFLAAGSTSEWLPVARLVLTGDAFYDTSENFLAVYNDYVHKKYGTSAPPLPDNEARRYILEFDRDVKAMRGGGPRGQESAVPRGGCFATYPENRRTVDFYMAWGEGVADSILYFASLLKKQFSQKIVGAFYGYNRVVHQSGNFTGLSKLFHSPLLDFCAAPGDYENRQPGGWEALRTPFDSYRLHNTLFFAEDDTRTHKENPYYRSAYGVYTEEDACHLIKRNFGKKLCGGNLAWWFDQHHGGGRYDSPEILGLLKKQSEIWAQAIQRGRYKQNEIALVFDTESRIAASHETSHLSVTLMNNFSLGRIGAPYDQYLLDDLENESMPDYKLYIFAAAYVLRENQRAFIHKKLQKNNATALWLYGAGYIDPDAETTASCANCEKLTGFSVQKRDDRVYDGYFKITAKHPAVIGTRQGHIYGRCDEPMNQNENLHAYEPRPYAYPLFYTEDAQILGRYCEGNGGALAVKEYNGFTSLFCGAKFLQYDLVRCIAKSAGCHIYSDDGDVIYAGSGYLTIHASTGGEKTIHLAHPCTPIEVYENKKYGENTDLLRFFMTEGETKMFAL